MTPAITKWLCKPHLGSRREFTVEQRSPGDFIAMILVVPIMETGKAKQPGAVPLIMFRTGPSPEAAVRDLDAWLADHPTAGDIPEGYVWDDSGERIVRKPKAPS